MGELENFFKQHPSKDDLAAKKLAEQTAALLKKAGKRHGAAQIETKNSIKPLLNNPGTAR